MAHKNNPQLHSRIHAILNNKPSQRTLRPTLLALAAILLLATLSVSMLHVRADESTTKPSTNSTSDSPNFPYSVNFTTTSPSFLPGDNITITSIHGTADTLTLTHTYEIKGNYTLASADSANLGTSITAHTPDHGYHDPSYPSQTTHITKGTGNFTLVLPFLYPGSPHVTFSPARGQSFGGIYFQNPSTPSSAPR